MSGGDTAANKVSLCPGACRMQKMPTHSASLQSYLPSHTSQKHDEAPRIQRLETDVVNRIAAGEVVAKPANAVKVSQSLQHRIDQIRDAS